MRYRGLVNVRVVAARLARLDDLAFHVRPVDRQRKRRFQRPDGNLLLQFLGEPGTAEALICPRARPHNLVRVDAPRDAAQLELADDIGVYLDGLLDHHKIKMTSQKDRPLLIGSLKSDRGQKLLERLFRRTKEVVHG